jgi:hypothetical protein
MGVPRAKLHEKPRLGRRKRLPHLGCGAGLLEHLAPALVHRRAVEQILLVQLVFKPAIDAHFRIGFKRHVKECFLSS